MTYIVTIGSVSFNFKTIEDAQAFCGTNDYPIEEVDIVLPDECYHNYER